MGQASGTRLTGSLTISYGKKLVSHSCPTWDKPRGTGHEFVSMFTFSWFEPIGNLRRDRVKGFYLPYRGLFDPKQP